MRINLAKLTFGRIFVHASFCRTCHVNTPDHADSAEVREQIRFLECVPNAIQYWNKICSNHSIEFWKFFHIYLLSHFWLFNDLSPFKKQFWGTSQILIFTGVKMLGSFHCLQVRTEVINVYFDETEELSAKTYMFHLSPSIVFHNLLNIPVTFLLEVCYIMYKLAIKY